MENKKLIEKWEIVEYRQEIISSGFGFDIEDIVQGYTVSDRFSNHDYELIESFDNEEEARKEFNNYEMELTSWISWRANMKIRYITEYELQHNFYEKDDEDDELILVDCDGEFCKIADDILAEQTLNKMKRLEFFELDTLEEFNEKLNDYDFFIDGKNTISEVFEREYDEEENILNVTYRYKNTYNYLDCTIMFKFDAETDDLLDSIYDVDFCLH